MRDLLGIVAVAVAVAVFAGTDVDDLIVLTVLFLSARAAGRPAVATGVASVMATTIANGADNISVYTPLFRTIGLVDSVVTVAVFAVGVAVWCLAGSWFGSRPAVVAVMKRFGRWIVPAVFIAIGAALLVESGVLTRLW